MKTAEKRTNSDILPKGQLAICFKNFLSVSEAKEIVKSVYAARKEWSEGFGGEQYSLGEAWYHYSEEDMDFDDYGDKAESSRALVEKYVPGLEKKVLSFLSGIAAPHPVTIREGWAGPGVMIFPAGNHVAQNGGSVHHDTDAFTDEELRNPDLKMFSFVCMLQKPVSGGDLQVWNKPYDSSLDRDQDSKFNTAEFESMRVEYHPGDLWMFNGMNAHRIHPFQGDTDRIALTFHMYREKDGWAVWF